MGYYPIKCIRCSHIMTNDTVLFDTFDAGIGIRGMLDNENYGAQQNDVEEFEEKKEETSASKGIWDFDDDDEDEDGSVFGEAKSSELNQYMTFAEIKKYSEDNDLMQCTPKWQKIEVTADFKTSDTSDLLIGVSFQKEKNGRVFYAKRRFCPACHCELPQLSGSMPTYNITLMGTSSSGKTVYLCALNWLLSQGQGSLPFGSSLSCVSANKANNDLVARSSELFNNGVLPGTTQIVLTEPLTLQLTFRIGDKMKKCLLAMADMRGEDLVAQDGENLTARGEFFSSADAFMLLVSPVNMPYIKNIIPNIDNDPMNVNVHQTLMSNINEYILPFFPNGTIGAPCAIMMSKCDLLMNNVDTLKIPKSNAVVAAELPAFKFTKTYFMNQDSGTRAIVKCDQSLYLFLQNIFSKSYFTSFSSLGRNISISEDEMGNQRVQNPNALHPIRVVDPIIYLLMSLGFLPQYYMMEAGSNYTKSNQDLLKKWMHDHL